MALNLDNIYADSTQEATGVGKDDTGTVTIQPTDSQPVQIQTSSSATAIQVNDDASIELNLGTSVNEIVNAFNDSTPNKNLKLATVQAVRDYFIAEYEGIGHFDFETKAGFDAKTWLETELPADVYVFDSTPFSYTDSGGKTATSVDWMKLHVHWDTSAEFHLIATSADSGQMTGQEIKTALFNVTDTNNFTDAYQAQLNNAPANINTEFASKQTSIDTLTTDVSTAQGDITSLQSSKINVSGGTFTGNLSTNNNQIQIDTSNGAGYLRLYRSNAPADQKEYRILAHNNGTLFFDTRNDSGVLVNRMTFGHATGDLKVPGDIYQNNNQVLDVTDIGTNINAGAGTITDTPTLKNYIDGQVTSFNGGTITNDLIISTTSESKEMLTLKRSNNAFDSGIAWQNSGSFYTASLFQDQSDSDKIKFLVGSNADINNLDSLLEISSNLVEVKKVGAALHVNGDIFAFNEGDMAARDISSVGRFSGNDYRLNSSLTDSNWSLYKATQGNTSGPEGTKAADGRSFSGEAVRIRVANSTNQGFIVENGIGLNLFEVNGSTGIVTTANNHSILGSLTVGGTSTLSGNTSITGNLSISNNITGVGNIIPNNNNSFIYLKDTGSTNYYLGRSEDDPAKTGIVLRTSNNPASGSELFRVESSGHSPRLYVEHSGILGTSNEEIKVGIDNDGAGGRTVLEEGNWSIIQRSKYYFQTFPTVSTTDIVSQWLGRIIAFIGVGTGTITLPSIVDANPSSSQVLEGETFVISNLNSGADITFTAASGQKFMTDNVGNISGTGASFDVFFSSSVQFVAMDLRSYATVGAYCWAVRGI